MGKAYFLMGIMIFIGYISPCHALTPAEILKLKNAGVSDKTIQIMLKQEEQGVREVQDDKGNTYIFYSTESSSERKGEKDREEAEKVKRAWDMLDNVIIDQRQQ